MTRADAVQAVALVYDPATQLGLHAAAAPPAKTAEGSYAPLLVPVDVAKQRWQAPLGGCTVECALVTLDGGEVFTSVCVEGDDLPRVYAAVDAAGLLASLPPGAVVRHLGAPDGPLAAAITPAAVGVGYPEFVLRLPELLARHAAVAVAPLAPLAPLAASAPAAPVAPAAAAAPVLSPAAPGPWLAAVTQHDVALLRRSLLAHPAAAAALVVDPARQWTLLHAVVKGGHADLVALCLLAGARIDARNHKGRTALHLAARAGRLDLARLLLCHGADPAATDAAGKTPGQRAGDAAAWRALEVRTGGDAVRLGHTPR